MMLLTRAMLCLTITGSVDRIESSIAVIIWDDESSTELPMDMLPRLTEGTRVRLRVVHRGGDGLAVHEHALLYQQARIDLPHEVSLTPGHHHRLRIRAYPSRTLELWRLHEHSLWGSDRCPRPEPQDSEQVTHRTPRSPALGWASPERLRLQPQLHWWRRTDSLPRAQAFGSSLSLFVLSSHRHG